MNEQTKPIDVLAVMDADGRAVACVIDDCKTGRRHDEWVAHLAQHDAARAAIAELIEDVRDYLADLDNELGPDPERLRAALANVSGGAA